MYISTLTFIGRGILNDWLGFSKGPGSESNAGGSHQQDVTKRLQVWIAWHCQKTDWLINQLKSIHLKAKEGNDLSSYV